MRSHRFKLQITQIIILSTLYFLSRMKLHLKRCFGIPMIFFIVILLSGLSTQIGCESFRKKFIRTPKHQPPPEEMVIYPKDYSKQELPSDEAYMQYYTYWKAWHKELINFLGREGTKKKIISCFDQTVLNLSRLKDLLSNEEKLNKLQGYIDKLLSLEHQIQEHNIAMVSLSSTRDEVEFLFRDIQRDFSFSKIKDNLKW